MTIKTREFMKSYDKTGDELDSAIEYSRAIQSGRCLFCGEELTTDTLTLDHLIPATAFGVLDKGNIALLCQPCNNDKGTLYAIDYWLIRKSEGAPLLIEDEIEFCNILSEIESPYREKYEALCELSDEVMEGSVTQVSLSQVLYLLDSSSDEVFFTPFRDRSSSTPIESILNTRAKQQQKRDKNAKEGKAQKNGNSSSLNLPKELNEYKTKVLSLNPEDKWRKDLRVATNVINREGIELLSLDKKSIEEFKKRSIFTKKETKQVTKLVKSINIVMGRDLRELGYPKGADKLYIFQSKGILSRG